MPDLFSDTPVQKTDTSAAAQRILERQLGSVGAWFLMLRPWIVIPPMLASLLLLWLSGAAPNRLLAIVPVQLVLVTFFVLEALGLSRQGAARFVTERQLSRSLLVTLLGIGLVCGLTGAWRSPFLPVLLAPTGVAFAGFGLGRFSRVMASVLAVILVLLALFVRFDPWGPLPETPRGVLSLVAVMVAAALLLAGVAGLTRAHQSTARTLDRMRGDVLSESRLRVRDLEAVGAQVAHDVRNPLAAVKSLLQLLARNESLEADQKAGRRIGVALEEVERIDQVLADYLSLSRPLRDLELSSVELGSLIDSVAQALETTAEREQVELTVHRTHEAPALLLDESRMRDALLNLASNALEASGPGGKVTLGLRVDDESVELSVEDRGVGMTEAELEQVGTPFYSSKAAGTGLGVVSARGAARQHGGSLSYESCAGQGTTARLRLPRPPPARGSLG